MTKSKKKANEDADYNNRVQKAVNSIRLGIYKLSYKAAEALGVKVKTVQARMKGRQTRSESHEGQKALTNIEEEELVRWITQLTVAGYPPHHSTFKAMAEALRRRRVAKINEAGIELVNYELLGDGWYKAFRNRHPKITTAISGAIEMNRMKDTTPEVVQAWFDVFKSTLEFYDIQPENIYNMDESGFSIGQIEASRIIINKSIR
jgi:Tc5 transposase DNA-binding domain